ncbi:MAG: hypothetical protein U0263_11445 [Polyangiaceae bacterium]
MPRSFALPLMLAASASADPPRAHIGPKPERPLPSALLGMGAGPAWPGVSDCPYGYDCHLPLGLALHGFAWAPVVDGFAVGAVGEHLRVPWKLADTHTFTFVGAGMTFGSGYRNPFALALWVALGQAFSPATGPCSQDSNWGLQLGMRVDHRLADRYRVGVSASLAGGGGGVCSGAAETSKKPAQIHIAGETVVAIDLTFEWVRAP